MSRLRPFRATDLFAFNRINLDHFTETYSTPYYLNYLATWPELCFVASHAHCYDDQDGQAGEERLMGYLFGKAEGRDGGESSTTVKKTIAGRKVVGTTSTVKERHGHVTAVTVGPEFRRLGLAKEMMDELEDASSAVYDAYFIDLFVRPSNALAVGLYQALEYQIYRRVKEYYGGGGPGGSDEDGYDMRKALVRDKKRETVRDSQKGMNVVVDVHQTIFEPAYRT